MSAASLPLEPFDGPLDLLLDEVRRQKIVIEEVALAPLVARYLDYLQAAAASQQPLDIDWILLAATLIHWKSRSLLPVPAGEPVAADPIRDEIVGLLLAHRKEAAANLDRRRSAAAGPVSPGGHPELLGDTHAEPGADPPFVSVWDLTQQARDLGRWAAHRSQQRREWQQALTIESEDISVGGMIELLRARLRTYGTPLDASRLLAEQPNPFCQVHLFLAILELAREQRFRILQTEEFAAIWLASLPSLPAR